jgi:hypothetical protein
MQPESHELIPGSNEEPVARAIMNASLSQFKRLTWVIGIFCGLLLINTFMIGQSLSVQQSSSFSKQLYATQQSTKANCISQVIRAATPAYAKTFDLAVYDKLNAEVLAFLNFQENSWIEGHSGSLTVPRQLLIAQASRPEIRTICEVIFQLLIFQPEKKNLTHVFFCCCC